MRTCGRRARCRPVSNTYVKPRTRLARRLLLVAGLFAVLAGTAGWLSAMASKPLIVNAAPAVAEGAPFREQVRLQFDETIAAILREAGHAVDEQGGRGGWSFTEIDDASAEVLARPRVDRVMGQALKETWRDGYLSATTRDQIGEMLVDTAIVAGLPTKLTDAMAENPPQINLNSIGLPDTSSNATYAYAAIALGAAAFALAAVAIVYADHRGLASVRAGKTLIGVAVVNALMVFVYGWMLLPGRQNLNGDALGALVRGVGVFVFGAALLLCALGGLLWWVGTRIVDSKPWLSDEAKVKVRDWGDEGDQNTNTASLWVLRSSELGDIDED